MSTTRGHGMANQLEVLGDSLIATPSGDLHLVNLEGHSLWHYSRPKGSAWQLASDVALSSRAVTPASVFRRVDAATGAPILEAYAICEARDGHFALRRFVNAGQGWSLPVDQEFAIAS